MNQILNPVLLIPVRQTSYLKSQKTFNVLLNQIIAGDHALRLELKQLRVDLNWIFL
jgi:hypothetical protein